MKLQIFCTYCKQPCPDKGYHETCKKEVEAFIPERDYPIAYLYYTEKDALKETREIWFNLAYNRLGIKIDIPKAKELLRYLLQERREKLPLIMIVHSPQEALKIARELYIPRRQNIELEYSYEELIEPHVKELRRKISAEVEEEVANFVKQRLEGKILSNNQRTTNINKKDYQFTEVLGIKLYEKLVKYDYFNKINILNKKSLERLVELTVQSNIFAGIYTNMLIILVEYPVRRDEQNYIFADGSKIELPDARIRENDTLIVV